MLNVIYGILIISFLATAHEFGHFIVAKLSHIPVEEFAIGFGPTIYEHTAEDGMKFKINVFPILGYNKLKGMDDNFDAKDGFYNRPFGPKFLTILAGPVMNLVVAILIFSVVFASFGNPLSPTTVIASVVPNSPAYMAGIQPNDKILKLNNVEINSWDELVAEVQKTEGKDTPVLIERNGQNIELTLKPTYDKTQKKWMVGISPKGEVYPVSRSFTEASKWTFQALYEMFTFVPKLFTRAGLSSLAGPIGIISMTGEAATGGFMSILFFVAYISIALAFTNLLPIPPLDGSWLVIILFEGITRKKVPIEKTAQIQSVALILMLLLMVFVSINDILRIFGK